MVDCIPKTQVSLRYLTLEDVPQVSAIEREAFPTLWPPTMFKKELNNRLAQYLVAWVPCSDDSNNDGEATNVISTPQATRSTATSFPLWRLLGGFRVLLGKREQNVLPPRQGYLVLGFLGMWFMVDEAHITAIAVRQAWRSKGIGETLMIGGIQMALDKGSRAVTLEVRVSNYVAQALYEKCGFKKVGVRRGYYTDNNEDAIIMTTDPIDTAEFLKGFQQQQEQYRRSRGDIVLAL
jgi:ribosomal-protein-alanine N-acetyltransferase